MAVEIPAEDFFVVGACRGLHVRGLECEVADDVLGRLALAHFFFEVREGLREEEGRDVGHEKIVEPVAFVQA